MSVLQLADARAHLGLTIPDAATDARLQNVIDAAEKTLSRRVGRLDPDNTTETCDGGYDSLLLTRAPVVSVESVTPYGGSGLAVGDFRLDREAGLIYSSIPGTIFPAATYAVEYLYGRSQVPADLMQAIRELVRILWQRMVARDQRNPSPVAPWSDGTKLPPEVEVLVASHEREVLQP